MNVQKKNIKNVSAQAVLNRSNPSSDVFSFNSVFKPLTGLSMLHNNSAIISFSRNKTDKQKELEHEKIISELYFANYGRVVSNLLNKGVAEPFSNYIEIDKSQEKPVLMIISNDKDTSDTYNYSADEFIEVLNKLKDMHISEYPEEKDNYNMLTSELEKKLKEQI